MRKVYLKIRRFNCPFCESKRSLETVMKGVLTSRKKERRGTEQAIGYHCNQCGIKKYAIKGR